MVDGNMRIGVASLIFISGLWIFFKYSSMILEQQVAWQLYAQMGMLMAIVGLFFAIFLIDQKCKK